MSGSGRLGAERTATEVHSTLCALVTTQAAASSAWSEYESILLDAETQAFFAARLAQGESGGDSSQPSKKKKKRKLRDDDEVMAFELASSTMQGPSVVTNGGRDFVVRERKFGMSKRGGRGKVILQRGSIDVWHREPIIALGTKEDAEPESEEDTEVE